MKLQIFQFYIIVNCITKRNHSYMPIEVSEILIHQGVLSVQFNAGLPKKNATLETAYSDLFFFFAFIFC